MALYLSARCQAVVYSVKKTNATPTVAPEKRKKIFNYCYTNRF
jgi:hypothetical protein